MSRDSPCGHFVGGEASRPKSIQREVACPGRSLKVVAGIGEEPSASIASARTSITQRAGLEQGERDCMQRAHHVIVLPIFIATICTSAFLLFSVQPMFAKMVLPTLGGAPAVWAVSLCFF